MSGVAWPTCPAKIPADADRRTLEEFALQALYYAQRNVEQIADADIRVATAAHVACSQANVCALLAATRGEEGPLLGRRLFQPTDHSADDELVPTGRHFGGSQ